MAVDCLMGDELLDERFEMGSDENLS